MKKQSWNEDANDLMNYWDNLGKRNEMYDLATKKQVSSFPVGNDVMPPWDNMCLISTEQMP